MADANAITLDAAAWLPPHEWAAAPEFLRRKYLERVRDLAIFRKRDELRRGLGVDGEKLIPRKHPRADGAKGPPLIPHRVDSRTWKRVRGSIGKGHVTIWWGAGWGKVLGYHREGAGPLPVRDVIGFTPAGGRWLRDRARDYWRSIFGHGPPPHPTRLNAPRPARPKPALPVRLPIAARPLVRRYPQLGPYMAQ